MYPMAISFSDFITTVKLQSVCQIGIFKWDKFLHKEIFLYSRMRGTFAKIDSRKKTFWIPSLKINLSEKINTIHSTKINPRKKYCFKSQLPANFESSLRGKTCEEKAIRKKCIIIPLHQRCWHNERNSFIYLCSFYLLFTHNELYF